jgi:hypothetical protein
MENHITPLFSSGWTWCCKGHKTSKQQQQPVRRVLVFFFVLFCFFFYYSYVHTRLGSILPPAPTPSLTTHSAQVLVFVRQNDLYESNV